MPTEEARAGHAHETPVMVTKRAAHASAASQKALIGKGVVAMRDCFLSRAIATGEMGGWLVSRFLKRWRARRSIRKLTEFDDYMQVDIGMSRCDLRWAAGLPLTVNAAIALDERAWQKRPSAHEK
jgi:hypothetical protein